MGIIWITKLEKKQLQELYKTLHWLKSTLNTKVEFCGAEPLLTHTPQKRGRHFTPLIKGAKFTLFFHPLFFRPPSPKKEGALDPNTPMWRRHAHGLWGVRAHCLVVVVSSQGLLGMLNFSMDTKIKQSCQAREIKRKQKEQRCMLHF